MSDNEVIVKSGKVADIGGVEWDVRDSDARTVFADFVTESRIVNGISVYVSFGAASVDFQNKPVIDVNTRLRMDLVTAQVLHAALGDLIRQSQQPPDKSVTN